MGQIQNIQFVSQLNILLNEIKQYSVSFRCHEILKEHFLFSFLDAYFESQAASELPIWRVYRRADGQYPGVPLSNEGLWDATWGEVERLRALDPNERYVCEQSIYRSED